MDRVKFGSEMKKRIVVLSGAGISAESGLKTFRDSDGLWENHDIQEVATPEAWERNRGLVLRFYNERRTQLGEAKPNAAHRAVADLEQDFDVHVITQNVDDLHERGGSTKVMHLHGQLTKVRSTINDHDVWDIGYSELVEGDCCDAGAQARPHIVWFGEAVPLIEAAAESVSQADILIIVGTSLNVYPAAGLKQYAPLDCPIYLIDPDPALAEMQSDKLHVITENAGIGMPRLVDMLNAE